MNTFKDKYDQSWTIDLDLQKARVIENYNFSQALRTQEEFYIQFFPPQENLFDELLTNTAVCFGMIWCLVKEQLDNKNYRDVQSNKHPITNEEDFARCFDGEALDRARLALYAELPDFFLDQKITLTTLRDRTKRAFEIADEKMAARLAERLSDSQITRLIDSNLQAEQEEFEEILQNAQKELRRKQKV